jgi:hypothetical protein
MKGALLSAKIHSLMRGLRPDLRHTGVLKPLLQLAHVRVADWPWERPGAGALGVWGDWQRLREQRRARHFVEREAARDLNRAPERDMRLASIGWTRP